MAKKISDFVVAIDLDTTIYDLLTPWLKWYNEGNWLEEGESLPVNPLMAYSTIKRWGWHEDVDPRCGTKLYQFFRDGHCYESLDLFPGAQKAIRAVHDWGVTQIFVSTTVTRHGPFWKQQAIDKDFPFIGKEKLLISGGYKGAIRANVLVDDGPHNLDDFKARGGTTVVAQLQDLGYNRDYRADGHLFRWGDYPDIIDHFLAKEGL